MCEDWLIKAIVLLMITSQWCVAAGGKKNLLIKPLFFEHRIRSGYNDGIWF